MEENTIESQNNEARLAGRPTKSFRPQIVRVIVVFLLGALCALLIPGLFGGSATKIDSTVIKNSFNDVAELATEEYSFTGVGKFDDAKKIGDLDIPLTGKSFLVTYSGTIKAGIKDTKEISVNIDERSKKVLVKAPAADVLGESIDPASVEIYDQSFNPLNQVSVDDVTNFLSAETDKNRDEAIKGGLLQKSEEHTTRLLKSHVKAVLVGTDKADYEVEVKFAGGNL